MRVFLNLIVLSVTLATCYGFCTFDRFDAKLENGKFVMPKECVDPFDNSRHSFGSSWNTAQCLKCSCSPEGMGCCSRYGVVKREGCTAILNQETCEYEFFQIDDPSKPCS